MAAKKKKSARKRAPRIIPPSIEELSRAAAEHAQWEAELAADKARRDRRDQFEDTVMKMAPDAMKVFLDTLAKPETAAMPGLVIVSHHDHLRARVAAALRKANQRALDASPSDRPFVSLPPMLFVADLLDVA